jgi:hypothetical protein
MYTCFGNGRNTWLNGYQDPYQGSGSYQPGGAYATTCNYSDYNGTCWVWPTDQWVTVLIHITPGHQNGDSNDADPSSLVAYKDTGIEVWVANYGDTAYTKIWEKMDYVWNFWATGSSPRVNGFNIFTPSNYMNGAMANASAFWRRFDQVIFSKKFIPCPSVYA